MSTMGRVFRYEASNVLRGKVVVACGLLFAAIGEALLRFGGHDTKALLSLVNAVLLLVPLLSLVFGAMYLYGAREFNETLLAQPVKRRDLFTGLFLGVASPLAGTIAFGIALPFLIHGVSDPSHWAIIALLIACTVVLTMTFVAIAFWIALRFEDRARGLGLALVCWLALAVLYDAMVLLVVTAFSDWPLERAVLVMMLLNPIDLARTLLVLQLDIAAMMGYTGAVFEKAFGTGPGVAAVLVALGSWCIAPYLGAARFFAHKDL